jgi:hypothetical protein
MKKSLSQLCFTTHKICKNLSRIILSWLHWGYGKRYLFHLDGVEEKEGVTYLSVHIRGKRVGYKIPIESIDKELLIEPSLSKWPIKI